MDVAQSMPQDSSKGTFFNISQRVFGGEKSNERVANPTVPGEKSPGVQRVEAIAATYSNTQVIILLACIFLSAFAYDLDGYTRYTYQSYATSSFGQLGLLSTVNVLRSVIGAAGQPTFAKLADYFGRFELVCVAVMFYVVGTIIESQSFDVNRFAAGAILYQVGYTGMLFLNQVLIGDFVSLRFRVLATFIPITPYMILTWVSGDVTSAVLGRTTWSWGIGMWAIIFPVVTTPLLICLWFNGRKAEKSGALVNHPTPFKKFGFKGLLVDVFWGLDTIGVILMIAVFALILTPLTLAGGQKSKWKEAHIIAPLVVGFCTIPFFVLWEMKAKHPVVPFRLLKDRGVWSGLAIALFFDFAWYMQGDYLYTILVVAFDSTVKSATRITSIYTFTSTLTGTILGFVVTRVPRLKPFIIFGIAMWLPAFGILIRYRSGSGNEAGVIGGQIMLGFGAGFFSYPTQTALQAAVKHEHMATITGLYLATFYLGSAFGSAVSGAVYTNILPTQLNKNLAKVTSNTTIAELVYASPLYEGATFPWGSPERDAIVASYRHVQKILCVVGICLVIPPLFFAFFLRDPKLTNRLESDQAIGVGSDVDSRDSRSITSNDIDKSPIGA